MTCGNLCWIICKSGFFNWTCSWIISASLDTVVTYFVCCRPQHWWTEAKHQHEGFGYNGCSVVAALLRCWYCFRCCWYCSAAAPLLLFCCCCSYWLFCCCTAAGSAAAAAVYVVASTAAVDGAAALLLLFCCYCCVGGAVIKTQRRLEKGNWSVVKRKREVGLAGKQREWRKMWEKEEDIDKIRQRRVVSEIFIT